MSLSSVKSVMKKVLPTRVRDVLRSLEHRLLVGIFYILASSTSLKSPMKAVSKKWVECLSFESIENYALLQPKSVEFIRHSLTNLHYSPPRFDGADHKDSVLTEVPGYKKYVAMLKNVSVIGGSNLILTGHETALYELKDLNKSKKFWYTDGGIECYQNNECLVRINDSNITFDTAINLTGNFSWNYYHLIYDVLAKFEQIDSLGLDPDIPLLIDSVCFDVPQYFELCTLLNTRGRKLVKLDKGQRYKVNRLYHFSLPNIIPPNYLDDARIEAEDVLFDLQALHYLRLKLLDCGSKSDFPKRIFISRNKVGGKREYNESEVFDVLKQYGFVTVCPEDYSIVDQIAMFNNAEFIAGGTGAAFSNLLFCGELCKVMIFTNYELPLSIFSTIADYVGADLIYLNDDTKRIDDMKNIHDSFAVNCERVDGIVSEWMTESCGSILHKATRRMRK